MLFLWMKVLHIVAVISWMAALLYLPRLFVYHASADTDDKMSATFVTMEQRLLKIIATPAMILTWIFGFYLAIDGSYFTAGAYWLHAKLLIVLLLTGFHFHLAGYVKKFGRGLNTRSVKYYRLLNEVPTVLLIIIVILVVVKPF